MIVNSVILIKLTTNLYFNSIILSLNNITILARFRYMYETWCS